MDISEVQVESECFELKDDLLGDELFLRLRVGDRPNKNGVDPDALLAAAKVLGIVDESAVRLEGGSHNRTVDILDRDYPGWRGYSVPETEGVRG